MRFRVVRYDPQFQGILGLAKLWDVGGVWEHDQRGELGRMGSWEWEEGCWGLCSVSLLCVYRYTAHLLLSRHREVASLDVGIPGLLLNPISEASLNKSRNKDSNRELAKRGNLGSR
jgi:hypothetical protein